MPIEDVDFLKQNSIKQSYMFLVNSKDRDKLTHRDPSSYTVEFENPFQNVVGFEVIDATIPRTMYNIDVYNNSIRFFIYSVAGIPDVRSVLLSDYEEAFIDPGDYSLQTLVPALSAAMEMHLNNLVTQPLARITAHALSDPPEKKSKLRFSCPYPFVFDMKGSTIAESIGFDELARLTENALSVLNRRYDYIIASEEQTMSSKFQNHQLYKSVDLPISQAQGELITAFEGPRGVLRSIKISPTAWAAQRFTVPTACYFTRIYAAITAADGLADNAIQCELRKGSASSPFNGAENVVAQANIAISFLDGTLSDSEPLSNPPLLLPGVFYWAVFKNENELVSIYYNDVVDNKTTMQVTSTSGATWSSLDFEDLNYNLSIRVEVNEEFHQVIAPGIYSLIGEKYIVLRCNEIEENSYRSLAYSKYNLGLAKFKLGVVGYSENRQDFSKVPLREFHPIGKLARLTIRFETAKGEIYDFKGVNHTITFAIHYYEPIHHARFEQSILNPNYKQNFIDYMYRQDDQESDSDDQEVDYSRDRINDYEYQEQRNLESQVRLRDLKIINGTEHAFDD